jgi:multidrug efflux pump subunit AcrA (membrane-fusion protein)
MQHELVELQPVLATTAAQVDAMMITIASDKEEAAATRAQVQGQEREANEQAAAAKTMAADAQRELDAALPALDAAVASLKNLSRWVLIQGPVGGVGCCGCMVRFVKERVSRGMMPAAVKRASLLLQQKRLICSCLAPCLGTYQERYCGGEEPAKPAGRRQTGDGDGLHHV